MEARPPMDFFSDAPYLACPLTQAGRLRPWAQTRPDNGSVSTQGLVYLLAKSAAEGGQPDDADRITRAYHRALVGERVEAARLIAGCTHRYTQRQLAYILFLPIAPDLAIGYYAKKRKPEWFDAAAHSLMEWEYPGVEDDARMLIQDAEDVDDYDGTPLSMSSWGQRLRRWLKRQEGKRAKPAISFARILRE